MDRYHTDRSHNINPELVELNKMEGMKINLILKARHFKRGNTSKT